VSTYFACRWLHDFADEPVLLFEELDEQRYETRKVHQYADGRLVRTDRVSDLSTSLAWVPVLPEDEIASQREFEVLALSAEQFEEVWRQATDAS
jgi:hypothetical protein